MISKLKNKIRTFFGFSSAETNGLILLIPIILLILCVPSVLQKILKDQIRKNDLEDEKLLRAWLEESKSKLKAKKETPVLPSFFDPNKITRDQWIALGFREKIADRIVKYRLKGGTFRKKKDLLKIYGINKELVRAYHDYIILPVPKREKEYKPSPPGPIVKETTPTKEFAKIDLNLADTAHLRRVRGIGSVLSSRIVKYRKALGGFIRKDQLKEVYGIKDEVYQRILEDFNTDSLHTKKVNINQDSIKLLARHPYVSYPMSRAIVKYRLQHGDYQSIDELKNIHIISDSLFQKIAPYLMTSPLE